MEEIHDIISKYSNHIQEESSDSVMSEKLGIFRHKTVSKAVIGRNPKVFV